MRIILATGIYPPEIGGTATYAHELFRVLKEKGLDVCVVSYGRMNNEQLTIDNGVMSVSKSGNFFSRWKRYARALQAVASDADVVIALSSVSVGIPLLMAKLKKPKKILRLGGDFFWERYTDRGGMKSLQEWYASGVGFWKLMNILFMGRILRSFDALVYSTEMQRQLHTKYYQSLPSSTTLENALPLATPVLHTLHQPMRLLCMSRFVGFKNLLALLSAVKECQGVRLTMVGSGPMRGVLLAHAERLQVNVDWRGVVSDRKEELFKEYDLLVIPSTTEISPNTALEARSCGLPVLLTKETGLSSMLTQGMVTAPLRSPPEISTAIEHVREDYEKIAKEASAPTPDRSWSVVADDWIHFLSRLS
ncbi:MAG: glycosyltransferase family 4 protein [Candidatus Peribacteraceae bacterium]